MDDISQTVVHLSKHMISCLSTSVRGESGDSASCSSPKVDTGIFEGLHNPGIFFQNLFGRQKSSGTPQHLYPQIFARIRSPFAGLNFSRNEKITVKSRRVVDVDDQEGSRAQGNDLNFRPVEKSNSESSFKEWSPVKHTILQEAEVNVPEKTEVNSAVSKEELGRSTWTFLHTLAAQFPDQPTKQQQRDVKELMVILSRIYPCKDCADHFKDVLRAHPVDAKSGEALAQWMCRVHNVVNRSIGKPQFPCHRVDLRWGAMNCDEGACDLHGRFYK
ncbi:hypothetical protein R1sor_017625 [Riccia sorocarpa]|uniref:Sulfhydryl oxidase n=1 Tax=Riccia sorocarpa TaxID=122646 RepID=A0ABD3I7F2_9MARC